MTSPSTAAPTVVHSPVSSTKLDPKYLPQLTEDPPPRKHSPLSPEDLPPRKHSPLSPDSSPRRQAALLEPPQLEREIYALAQENTAAMQTSAAAKRAAAGSPPPRGLPIDAYSPGSIDATVRSGLPESTSRVAWCQSHMYSSLCSLSDFVSCLPLRMPRAPSFHYSVS